MPEMTYAEALAELGGMTNPTIEQLRDLVSRTSVAQVDLSVPAKATILYSGPLSLSFHDNGDPLRAGEIAVAMAEADPSLKIIDNTQVGKLLADPGFRDKLLAAAGDPDVRSALLFKPDGGITVTRALYPNY